MEMQSLATGRDVMMQVGDAYSGALHIINLPAGCSVRELRDAVRLALSAREASAAGACGDSGASSPQAERIELLCVDEATDDAPVELEDGRWLSHYALPHEEKRVVAYRQRGCCSARLRAGDLRLRGVGADLRDLLHSMGSALGRSGLLSISGRASSCDSGAAESTPALLRELLALSGALQEKDTRMDSRLSMARKQVEAMGRALVEARVQDDAVYFLGWFAEEKERLAREASALRGGAQAHLFDESEAEEKLRAQAEAALNQCSRTAERLQQAGSVEKALADWLLQGALTRGKEAPKNALELVGKAQRINALMQHCRTCLADQEPSRRKTLSKGSLSRTLGSNAGDVVAAVGGGMVSVGAAGEDDPDSMTSKRRSVSFELDNKYEVVLRTISSNVSKAQKKLTHMEQLGASVSKAVEATSGRARRLLTTCEHAAADAILKEEVRHAEEEAKSAKARVDSESRLVDELSNEVTSLSHMCGQQLLKWQDLVTQDLAHGFSAAFPNAAQAEEAQEDGVTSLNLIQAVEVLGWELDEAESCYEALRGEVARRGAFERSYRQKLRQFVSQMEAAREVERQHRAHFWQQRRVVAVLLNQDSEHKMSIAAAYLRNTPEPPALAAAIRPYPAVIVGSEGDESAVCDPLPDLPASVDLLHPYLVYGDNQAGTGGSKCSDGAAGGRPAGAHGNGDSDAPAHKSTGGGLTASEKSGGSDDLEFSCVSLTSSDVRCTQMPPAHLQTGGGEAPECSELALDLARQRENFVRELEKQAEERDRARAEWEAQRANEMKSAREREEQQQREEQRERELARAREWEWEQERSRAVDNLELAVAFLENSMDTVLAEARHVDQRIKTNEEALVRARTRAAEEAEEVGEAADGEEHAAASGRDSAGVLPTPASQVAELAKSKSNTKAEEQNNDPELMCSQLMSEVKRERKELRGTLMALAESQFSFADQATPQGQVQHLKNSLKRASQYVATLCYELDELQSANETVASLAPELASTQEALSRCRMRMHDLSTVLGLAPLSTQSAAMQTAWAACGDGGSPSRVAQIGLRVAALRVEAQVLADGMELLADSLHTLPEAREYAKQGRIA